MTYLTGKDIIDGAMTIIKNNSASVRGRMTVWLNVQAQKLAVVRPWIFLNDGSAIIIPMGNVIALPPDFGQFQSLQAGTSFFLTSKNNLTQEEAWAMDKVGAGVAHPRGYTEGNGAITLHGGSCIDPISLSYTIEPPPITDTPATTVWPAQCGPLFMRSMLDFFYEYDMDDRASMSYQLNAIEISELKKWDNSRKPRTQTNRHGYRASR